MRQNLTSISPKTTLIGDILRSYGDITADKPVLFAPGRRPLTWAELSSQLDYISASLAHWGIRRGDPVAVALPDGPELAVAFLTISATTAFAPLNPAYRADDFEFYLKDLQAKALILPEGHDSPARGVAHKYQIQILELTASADAPAGQFQLRSESADSLTGATSDQKAQPDDVALILHTSGTTSRPKMVPLSQRNLCRSARHIADTLGLTSADRTLCAVPLFHVHGLIGSLFSSVVAGASVVCPPAFSTRTFFDCLKEFAPTWFSAVPTMHQAILAAVADHMSIVSKLPLRLIRSSSAALPPQVLRKLEEVFGAPVIEAYGMTEGSHQIASNGLQRSGRKPGSVGRPAGPEVAIMNGDDSFVENGKTGEIVIRGPNVTAGYANHGDANKNAFTNGWFRTGDQGYFDSDGFLFITGRLKEIINRGGEKIAPREIDEVLLDHPAVAEAVAFALPHPTLGEDVAAAVVLKAGVTFSENELREFALERLLEFKVPARIVIVTSIPKGPTGKNQRIGLADRLANELAVIYEPPASAAETLVADEIGAVLNRHNIGRDDNFFAIGGDSLRAMQVISRLKQKLGIEIPVFLLFKHPTPAALAVELNELLEQLDVTGLAGELEKLDPEEISRLLDESAPKEV